MGKQDSITRSMIYKSLERYSLLIIQTVVSIVIARILSPSDYGVVAMMTVFISIASIFINSGFNMALVQRKNADRGDYNTALIINICIGLFFYTILFFASPAIASFYNEPSITSTLRVLALVLPLGAISSIQTAIATREMRFKVMMMANLIGGVISGAIGITLALLGYGVWALIVQQLTSVVCITITMAFILPFKFELRYKAEGARAMFAFGWKLLVAGLINQIYNELNSLIIGKKYLSSDLAFYNKGKSFPSVVTTGIDGAVSTVSFAALSRKQEDRGYMISLMQKTLIANSYLLFFALCLLAMSAEALTSVLLTDKWLPMVPYLQICCFTFAFHPMASLDMQAIAAIGRSDLRLKLEFIKKPIGILLLIVAVPYGPIAIALSAAATSIISLLVGAIACEKTIGYSVGKHFIDILPIILVSSGTCVVMYVLGIFRFNPFVMLVLQLISGAVFYILLSAIFKLEGYIYLKGKFFSFLNNRFKK